MDSPEVDDAEDRRKLRRTTSAEEFALAFGDVKLHLETPDDTAPLPGRGSEINDLADFSEYWADSGLPPKDPAAQVRWNKQAVHQQLSSLSMQQSLAPRSLRSGATSPTEAGTETGTNASESWTGTTAADDIVSTLSNDTDDCDTASRSSVKRRRMTQTSSSTSFGFQPLAQVKESADGNGESEPDVRPWKVDIPDHDVVLGDTHEPTWGTKIYRDIRKAYAKKTITNEQLKHIKQTFQERVEKELGKKLACLPRFWCNKEVKAKAKQIPVSGFLKSRPGMTYAYAKDEAIKDDIKNASARPRTRTLKLFAFKGSLDEVVEKALETCDAWVGDDIDKELYAKGFKEDIYRMTPWRSEYVEKKQDCERKADAEPVMRRTHMREARIHESHVSHLETVMVDMINQLGNMMIESHRADSKKSNKCSVSDACSMEDSSAGAKSAKARSSQTRPSGTAKSCRKTSVAASAKSTGSNSNSKKKNTSGFGGPDALISSRSAFYNLSDIHDMDLSPIDVRKTMSLDMHIAEQPTGNTHGAPSRKDLSSMFSQNLRMGSLEDGGNGFMNTQSGNVAVVMPPGLPREVRPGGPADELSVLSAPDDSLLFMEARESAIRRGLDHPGALPQPGQVADRTKALLQQMKTRRDSKSSTK